WLPPGQRLAAAAPPCPCPSPSPTQMPRRHHARHSRSCEKCGSLTHPLWTLMAKVDPVLPAQGPSGRIRCSGSRLVHGAGTEHRAVIVAVQKRTERPLTANSHFRILTARFLCVKSRDATYASARNESGAGSACPDFPCISIHWLVNAWCQKSPSAPCPVVDEKKSQGATPASTCRKPFRIDALPDGRQVKGRVPLLRFAVAT